MAKLHDDAFYANLHIDRVADLSREEQVEWAAYWRGRMSDFGERWVANRYPHLAELLSVPDDRFESQAKKFIAGTIVLDDELVEATFDACWDAIKK